MSALYVRAELRAAVSALLPGFVFVESVNLAERTADLPDRFYTLDFVAADDTRISLGVPALFRETGAARVMIFTPQQIGDADALAACETVRAAMCNYADASGSLRVLDAGPPTDLDGGDFRGSFYGLTVDLRYQFDRLA